MRDLATAKLVFSELMAKFHRLDDLVQAEEGTPLWLHFGQVEVALENIEREIDGLKP